MFMNQKFPLLLFCLLFSSAATAQTGASMPKGNGVTEADLIEALALRPTTRNIKIATSKIGLLITFDTNSGRLSDEGKAILDVVARAFRSEKLTNSRFLIVGHVDSRGNRANNLRLSIARANSARDYLVDNRGIRSKPLSATGKGDREPLNREQLAAPENRRVEFVSLR